MGNWQCNIFWSPRTIKPPTSQVNNNDDLITTQRSAMRPWVLAFMWMTLDMNHPLKHCCKPGTRPLVAVVLPDGSGPPSRAVCPTAPQELLRNGLQNITKSSRHWPGLQTSQVPMQSCIYGTILIHGGPISQPTNLKGSAVQRSGDRHHRTTLEVLFPHLDGSVSSLIQGGALHGSC